MTRMTTRVSSIPSLALRFVRSKFPAARSLCWSCARHLGDAITINTGQGRLTVCTNDTAIGQSLFLEGQYELDLANKVKALLFDIGYASASKELTLVDVGANIGIISISLLRDGFISQAIAVEPEPFNHSLLRENLELNGLMSRVICIEAILSSFEGQTTFELSSTNFGDHRVRVEQPDSTKSLYSEEGRRVVNIHSTTLDAIDSKLLCSTPSDSKLLWIDVQGHEGYVFRGGATLLSQGIPTVAEIWPYGILRSGMTLDDFFMICSGLWSEYWVLRRKRFVRYPINAFPDFLAELGQDGDYDNVVFTRVGVNTTYSPGTKD